MQTLYQYNTQNKSITQYTAVHTVHTAHTVHNTPLCTVSLTLHRKLSTILAKCTLFTIFSLSPYHTLSLTLTPPPQSPTVRTPEEGLSTIHSTEIQNEVVETVEMEHTKKTYHEAEHLRLYLINEEQY